MSGKMAVGDDNRDDPHRARHPRASTHAKRPESNKQALRMHHAPASRVGGISFDEATLLAAPLPPHLRRHKSITINLVPPPAVASRVVASLRLNSPRCPCLEHSRGKDSDGEPRRFRGLHSGIIAYPQVRARSISDVGCHRTESESRVRDVPHDRQSAICTNRQWLLRLDKRGSRAPRAPSFDSPRAKPASSFSRRCFRAHW
jgi:hypothetical protein